MGNEGTEEKSKQVAVVDVVLKDATEEEKRALLVWANELQQIRNSDLPVKLKAKKAIQATSVQEVILPLLKRLAAEVKRTLWTERGWWFRLGGGGILLAVITAAGKSIGVAGGFGAFALPVWLVIGGGGVFLGLLLDRLREDLEKKETTYTTIDAKKQDRIERKDD